MTEDGKVTRRGAKRALFVTLVCVKRLVQIRKLTDPIARFVARLLKRIVRIFSGRIWRLSPGLLAAPFLLNPETAKADAYVARTGSENPFGNFDLWFTPIPFLADVDGDGDIDVVVGDYDGGLEFLENTGTAQAPNYVARSGGQNPFSQIDVGFYSAPAMADLDNDGDLDLVVGEGYNDHALRYYENTGSAANPQFTQREGNQNPFEEIDGGYAPKPFFADLDNDGDIDFVTGDYDGNVYFFENTGTASQANFEEQEGTANPFNGVDVGLDATPTFADIDGDGDLDAIIGEYDGVINYHENIGSQTVPQFVERTGSANPFNGLDFGFYSVPRYADLDGDGDEDFIIGEGYNDGLIRYWERIGTGTGGLFEIWQSENFNLPAEQAIAAMDQDPDGDLASNLVEYALGKLPKTADYDDALRALLDDEGRLQADLVVRAGDPDLVFVAQYDDELTFEHAVEVLGQIFDENPDDGFAIARFVDVDPVTGETRRFARIIIRLEN